MTQIGLWGLLVIDEQLKMVELIQKSTRCLMEKENLYAVNRIMANVSQEFTKRNSMALAEKPIAGNLYATSIKRYFMTGDISTPLNWPSWRATGSLGTRCLGWILNDDDVHDIVANTFDGRMFSI